MLLVPLAPLVRLVMTDPPVLPAAPESLDPPEKTAAPAPLGPMATRAQPAPGVPPDQLGQPDPTDRPAQLDPQARVARWVISAQQECWDPSAIPDPPAHQDRPVHQDPWARPAFLPAPSVATEASKASVALVEMAESVETAAMAAMADPWEPNHPHRANRSCSRSHSPFRLNSAGVPDQLVPMTPPPRNSRAKSAAHALN